MSEPNGPSLAVSARGVTKVYGKGELAYQALRGVELEALQGEFVILAGPSGSGKTTLLSILGCVLTATSGDVRIYGEPITGKKERELPDLRLRYIGFIFQGHNLIASLSARDNVSLPLRMRGWTAREARAEAQRMLALVGLGDQVERMPNQLSGGQRQRVAIARALAGSPPLILADEPTASLDAESGLLVTNLLRDLVKELDRTAIVVTHDNRIFHLADRIIHIEDGRILQPEERASWVGA
jgi:putative ABC transport system ATP-binding protein